MKCDRNNPADKWFWAAYKKYFESPRKLHGLDGTYEAIGKHFQGNPYNMDYDTLIRHGESHINVKRTFYGIKKFLSENYIEGIVFYDKYRNPACKIKRSDFGFEWGNKHG